MKNRKHIQTLTLSIESRPLKRASQWIEQKMPYILTMVLAAISLLYYVYYLDTGLALNYNDARSHLDIGRRVVEGLKPGLAQLGSVWLPLNHILMVPLIWNDWAWHTGFAGAVWNMLGFVGTGVVIYQYLRRLEVGMFGRLIGVAVFAFNINILYLQATAMTEILLLFTMTVGCFHLLVWHQTNEILSLIKAAFWIMLATLVRYDGWFLAGFAGILVMRYAWIKSRSGQNLRGRFHHVEGNTILYTTLAATGIVAWFAWNQLIFKDALYFMLGPFSAHAQQRVMEAAGALPTKWNMLLSIKVYMFALLYSTYTYPAILAAVGLLLMGINKKLSSHTRWASTALLAPLLFNILALFLGFSVVYIQGISGDTWFNVRYGIMMMPSIGVYVGYLADKSKSFKPLLVGSLLFVLFFAFVNRDSVAIDDATVGSSQKNVSEVSGYLHTHAKDNPGFVLISAASHDAIIFSSDLPMKRFIHEGTGRYWEAATVYPDQWARWIVMRTHDDSDLAWRSVSKSPGFARYRKVASYPFADVYELLPEYVPFVNTEPVIMDNK